MRRVIVCAALLAMFPAPSWGGTGGLPQNPESTEIAGGRGGRAFVDPEMPVGARVVEVHVRSGDHVDSVQMAYSLPDGRMVMGARHGGSGGRLNVFKLDADEYIVGISGRYGDYIDSISIQTNRRSSPAFGGRGGNRDMRIGVPAGNQAVGFAGRAGDYLDAIGLVFAPLRLGQAGESNVVGGRGGSPFSDTQPAPGARIVEVRVRGGDHIDSIQAVYALPGGRVQEGPVRGGRGGRSATFRLDPDEYIVALSGRYGSYIDSLVIHTNKRSSPTFGGRGGDRDFRIDVPAGTQAVGFAGRAGDFLDAIGLTYSSASGPTRGILRRLPGRRPDRH